MIDTNSFCWNGIVSTDHDRAKSFYSATIGWHAVDHTFDNGDKATMFVVGEVPRGHLRAPGAETEPSRWTSYLRVDDVDASSTAAKTNGGAILIPPTDMQPGRFSGIATPSGASFLLFHEADENESRNAPPGEGSVQWTELHSNDIDADLPWLVSTFGFEVEEIPIPGGGTYFMLNHGGKPRCGAVAAWNSDFAGHWIPWINVANVDETLRVVQANDGRVIMDASDYPNVGRMAAVTDPEGAPFGIITPLT